jgi:YHS domain-containing protein
LDARAARPHPRRRHLGGCHDTAHAPRFARGRARCSPLSAQARSAEIYTGWLSSSAVGGYDPVAYFTEGRPVAGKSAITHQWKGAAWRFASEKNRDLFKAEPAKYAPQYGGYCAPISGLPEIGTS